MKQTVTDRERDELLDRVVRRITARFRPELIILFGSYARGKVTADSDLDLLVVMDAGGSCRRKANEIDLALADRTVPMDVIVMTPRQFERRKHLVGTIARQASQEGKILYDRAA